MNASDRPSVWFSRALFVVAMGYAIGSPILYSVYNLNGPHFGPLWIDQLWGLIFLATPGVAAFATYLSARDLGHSDVGLTIWLLLALIAAIQLTAMIAHFGFRVHGPRQPLTVENWFATHGGGSLLFALPAIGLLLSLTARLASARGGR
jgi:cytochrome bd-type quinol oxidase subunit 2